jgi:uncharacterized protein
MAALTMQRLGHLIGEPRYLQAAERTLALFAGEIARAPHGYGTLVGALAEYNVSPAVVMLTGTSAALAPWRAELNRRYLPGMLGLQLPDAAHDLPATLTKPRGPDAQAWVCRGTQCLPPISDLHELSDTLAAEAFALRREAPAQRKEPGAEAPGTSSV